MLGLQVDVQQLSPIPLKAQFHCAMGEVLAIVGPSGSGKSTLLRCVAGLYTPQVGRISFAGQDWLNTQKAMNQTTQQRRIGFVFQNFALFEHKTVLENITLGMSEKNSVHQALELLERVNLSGLEARYPEQLSGGQKQRVALARALAREPSVLLLDEPFSSVDEVTKRKLRIEMLSLVKQLHLPIVIVTHDLNEASFLANRMVVLHKGETLQCGVPEVVMRMPKNATVARLVDVRNLFSALVYQVDKKIVILKWEGQYIEVPKRSSLHKGEQVHWCIRPMDVLLHSRLRPSKGEKENPIRVVIQEQLLIGGIVTLTLALLGKQGVYLQVDLSPHVVERNAWKIGEVVSISLLRKSIHIMR